MILTDYYRFARIATKSKKRLDCIVSTHSYPSFEENRATKATKATEKYDATNVGDLVIYFGDVPPTFSPNVQRRADNSLTLKSKNVSSVFIPDVENNLGYGDFKGSTDALLLVFHNFHKRDGYITDGAELEIFVARGRGHDRMALYDFLDDGGLIDELNALRKSATPDGNGGKSAVG